MKTYNLIRPIGKIILGYKTPLIVLNHITFDCNLRCKYCNLPSISLKYRSMDTNTIKNAMREFRDIGTKAWIFSGGEPLIRDDIGELIKYAKNLGFHLSMVTNGYFVPDKIKDLKNLDFLLVSLDGSKKITDKNRGNGSFKKAINAIKIAKENGIKTYISSVISIENTKNNCAGLKELFKIGRKLNCKLNFQMIYFDQFNKSKVSNLFPPLRNYLDAFNLIANFKRKYKLVKTNLFSLKYCNHIFHTKNIKCFAGKFFCDLLPNGIVAPCYLREDEGLDGKRYGFSNAFMNLNIKEKCSCWLDCYIGWNRLFSLEPEYIKDYIKQFFIKGY